jgi:predicted ArsR family transcriptional regulator
MTAPAHKVTKQDVYEYVKSLIQNSKEKEMPLSAAQLAEHFHISIPTAYYHLTNLVKDRLIVESPRRGKHNTKYYRLAEKETRQHETKVFNLNEIDQFKKELEETLKETKKELSTITQKPLRFQSKTQEKKEVEQPGTQETNETKQVAPSAHHSVEHSQESTVKPLVRPQEQIPDFPKTSMINLNDDDTAQPSLTLDEKIERFLKESANVVHADQLLSRQDREILSVMTETIQQNIVYLKDLSQQLSTIQNKKMIQELIDERNRLLETINRLTEQNQALESQLKETKEKHQLDPERLRAMQQNLIYFVDTWLDQPNHALALGRRQFRESLVKQLNDVFRYVLGLE